MVAALMFLLRTPLLAQQNAQFSQYMFNGLYINPAYAGYKEQLYAHSFYRMQWAGLSGAPKTFTIGVDGTANDDRMGLGLIVSNDRIGAANSTTAMFNYAYKVQTSEDAKLSFGLAAGVINYQIRGSELRSTDEFDQLVPEQTVSSWLPDVNAGVFYNSECFYAGLSVTNLLSSYIKIDGDSRNYIPKLAPHYYLTVGGLFHLNESLSLKPSLLVKEEFKGPTNVDLNAMFLINNRIWLGGSYRTGVSLWNKDNLQSNLSKKDAIAFLAEVYAAERLRIGYSFDYDMTALRTSNNGSHEISLGYYFTTSKVRLLSPRYF